MQFTKEFFTSTYVCINIVFKNEVVVVVVYSSIT